MVNMELEMVPAATRFSFPYFRISWVNGSMNNTTTSAKRKGNPTVNSAYKKANPNTMIKIVFFVKGNTPALQFGLVDNRSIKGYECCFVQMTALRFVKSTFS